VFIFRLGVAYAGSAREDIKSLLLVAFEDRSSTMETLGLYALALGISLFLGFLFSFLKTFKFILKVEKNTKAERRERQKSIYCICVCMCLCVCVRRRVNYVVCL
jgi:hypothetical protein